MILKDYTNMEHVSDIIEKMDPVEDYPISTGFKFLDTVIGGYYPGDDNNMW